MQLFGVNGIVVLDNQDGVDVESFPEIVEEDLVEVILQVEIPLNTLERDSFFKRQQVISALANATRW